MPEFTVSQVSFISSVTLDPVRFAHFLSLVPNALRAALIDQLAADLRRGAAAVARARSVPPDWDGLSRHCDALAGLAGTIGAEATCDAATALAEAARFADSAVATTAHDRLTRAEASLLAEIGAAGRHAAARA